MTLSNCPYIQVLYTFEYNILNLRKIVPQIGWIFQKQLWTIQSNFQKSQVLQVKGTMVTTYSKLSCGLHQVMGISDIIPGFQVDGIANW